MSGGSDSQLTIAHTHKNKKRNNKTIDNKTIIKIIATKGNNFKVHTTDCQTYHTIHSFQRWLQFIKAMPTNTFELLSNRASGKINV